MTSETHFVRDIFETYNRIVEECFNRCVYTFNYRYLVDDEIDCASNCATKIANSHQRTAMNFAQIHSKKMIDAQEQQEQAEAQSLPVTGEQINENTTPS